MALVTRTLPSIANGISKQPPILRSSDQTEDELNTWGQIATGLGRRPPTETVALLAESGLESAFVHHINRDVNERYVVVIDQGVLRVFNQENGTEVTVNAPDGLGYLSADGGAYRAVTVADYTFIVNSEVQVALQGPGADTSASPVYYRFPGGAMNEVAAGSAYQYPSNPTTGATVTGTVQKFEDLPAEATQGQVYKVSGSAESGFTSYYVVKNGGVWDETVLPGLPNSLNSRTMPHALVREADGTFTFAPFSWRHRRVGDTQTNPAPPFVGRKIKDVFFYQNRLGFAVDESVVFSAAGDYGDFWRRTVLDYIDSDGLSAAAASTDVAILDYAVAFNDGMMLFSRQRQFSLTNGEAGLTASSVSIQPTTGYLMSAGVRPVSIGNQLYFASDANGYTAIQEYTRLDGSDSLDAADITAHATKLLPKGASQLIAAPDMDAVFVLVGRATTAGDRRKMFAYQFFWDGEKKLQSAWRHWDFVDGEPVSGAYVDGELHLIVRRPEGYFLEKMDLSPGAKSLNQEHLLFLDRGVSLTGVYDAEADETTFTIPYTVDPARFVLIRSGAADVPESQLPSSGFRYGVNTVTVPGDESGHPLTAGNTFRTHVIFSQQYPLDYQGRPLTTGRLQLHTFTVVYDNTAFFRSEVAPYGVDAVLADSASMFSQDFGGRVLGSSSLVLGQQAYHSGSYTFPVAADASKAVIGLSNESPYDCTFVSAEWEGLFFSRTFN